MKKNGLLKAIGIVFIVYAVFSWIIPTGVFSSGEYTASTTDPVGLVDLIKYPVITLTSSVFVLNAIIILFIGGLYGVLNKTGVYSKLIDKIVKKYKGKERNFLIISMLVFIVLASLTALTLPLFVMVPFFIAIILLLGYDKIVAFMATAGAILVGNMGSTYGFNINGYISYFLGNNINESILYRIIFLVVVAALYIFVTLKIAKKDIKKVKSTKKASSKKEEKEEEVLEIPFYGDNSHSSKKKSTTPMVVIGIVTMIIILVGMYNWSIGLGFTWFDDSYKAIMAFEINGYTLFANLIGSIDPIGYWSNYDLAGILVIVSIILGWIYNIKFSEIVKSFVDGAKKMAPVALYVMAAGIIFLLMNSSTSGNTYFATIANFFLSMTDKLNIFLMMIVSAIGGLFYNDYPYMLNSLYSQFTTAYTDFSLIGMIGQTIHGLVMMIAPTSVILVAGLSYLNISYKEWFKHIWKYLLYALVAIIAIVVLMSLIA